MLVNAVFYTIAAEHAAEAVRLLVALAAESRRESGCRRFEVNRSNDDPRVFVLYEEWDDAAALERHYATPHFIEFGVNGIRKLAQSRLGHQCTPLSA